MAKETKKISLLIPTMNRPGNIDRLLGSLQDFGYLKRLDLKPVVVDSSHDDATKRMCLTYPADYIRAEGLGKSSAMNVAIQQLSSEYVGFLDDDIEIMNGSWLDNLMSNFANKEVGYVSGRVVAVERSTDAQDKWEEKGALNKGGKRIEVGRDFFKRVRLQGLQVQLVTMGANHVVRREVLNKVGLHDERFGPGQPIGGAGADLDLTYKVLMHGHSIVYDPTAVVGHHHPESMDELRSKLFVYGISDTAIHTKFLMEFGDIRGLFQIFFRPGQNTHRMIKSLLGRYPLPADVILSSIAGNVVGPIEYFKHRNDPQRTSVTN